MFEAKLFGVEVGVHHLIVAAIVLSIVTTLAFHRWMRRKPVAIAFISVLVTQALVGVLLALLRARTAQPVHDMQTWVAHYLAYFNVILFWLLCPIFSGPTAVLCLLLLNHRSRP